MVQSHIGHLAVYIPADIFVRYHREKKMMYYLYAVLQPNTALQLQSKPKKKKTTPREIIDKYHKIIKESFTKLGISFDNYSRTSKKIHHETASEFLNLFMIKINSLKKHLINFMIMKKNNF